MATSNNPKGAALSELMQMIYNVGLNIGLSRGKEVDPAMVLPDILGLSGKTQKDAFRTLVYAVKDGTAARLKLEPAEP